MVNFHLKTHMDSKGVLDLHLPTDIRETDVEVIISIHPVSSVNLPADNKNIHWPPNFFQETYGSLADDPIERGPQGEYEERVF
jgi:hypothetical protein